MSLPGADNHSMVKTTRRYKNLSIRRQAANVLPLHQPFLFHIMHYAIDSLPALDIYRLLTGGVVPRPIAWVSTRSGQGVDNLAPFALFTIASVQPPVLVVTHLQPRNKPCKDTLVNLRDTKECVVSVVTHSQLDPMNATAAEYPPEISEFDAEHIARSTSQWVAVPGVQDAPIRYECRLREIQTLGNNPMAGALILLDVVGVSVNDSLLQDGMLNPALVDAIGKLGGDLYSSTREQCECGRPPVPATGA